MKVAPTQFPSGQRTRSRQLGQAKIVILVLIVLVCGFAAGFLWHQHQAAGANSSDSGAASSDAADAGLSPGTIAVLKRLNGPVEIRYYSLLDPAGASDELKAFARRVDHLLNAYQNASNSKLTVVRRTSQADDSTAAHADGLTPFNLDKGDACYLGIVVSLGAQKEVLARLSPDWEQAVEPDVTRALAKLLDAPQPGATMAAAPPSSEVIDSVKHIIPDVTATSLEDGKKLLQSAALQEYATAAKESGDQLRDAQQRLSQAQANGSDADQQAAMKNLQDLQAAQTAKLQEIAARARAEVLAFEQLKKAGR